MAIILNLKKKAKYWPFDNRENTNLRDFNSNLFMKWMSSKACKSEICFKYKILLTHSEPQVVK